MFVDERGSLKLMYDSELDQHQVHFADWYHVQGFGSLAAVRDWFEICSSHNGQPIKLNGSQAKTVRDWANAHH